MYFLLKYMDICGYNMVDIITICRLMRAYRYKNITILLDDSVFLKFTSNETDLMIEVTNYHKDFDLWVAVMD